MLLFLGLPSTVARLLGIGYSGIGRCKAKTIRSLIKAEPPGIRMLCLLSIGTQGQAEVQVSQEHTLTVNVLGGEDDNNAAVVTTGNDPRNYVEHYAESATGADGMIAFSEMQKAVIGSPQAFVDFDVANPVGWGCMSLPLAGPIGGSGTNSLIAMTAEGPGANCANGGQKTDNGPDNGGG